MQTLPNFRRSQKLVNNNNSLVGENSASYTESTSYPINQESILLLQTDRHTLSNATKMGTLPRNAKVASTGINSRPPSTSMGQDKVIYQKPKTIFDSVDSLDQPWYRTTAVKSIKNNKELTKKFEDYEKRRLLETPNNNKKTYYDTEEDDEGDQGNNNNTTNYHEKDGGTLMKKGEESRDPERALKYRRSQRSTTYNNNHPGNRGAKRTTTGCFSDDYSNDLKSDENFSDESSCRSNGVSFCITLFVIFDIFIVIMLNLFGYILKCSSDGWLYQSDIAQGLCKYVWTNVIPFYKRKFVCPSPPTSYFTLQEVPATSSSLTTNMNGRDYGQSQTRDSQYPNTLGNNMNRQTYGNAYNSQLYNSGNFRSPQYNPNNPMMMNGEQQNFHENDFKYEQLMMNFTSLYLKNDLYWPMKLPWDSDTGFGHPPHYFSVTTILDDPPTDEERRRFNDHLYRIDRPGLKFFYNKDSFINSINYNVDWTFPILTNDAILIFAIIIPILAIAFGEMFTVCLVPSRLMKKRLRNQFCFRVPQVIRRILRFIVIYIGGLFLTICFTELLKIFFGRLRPDFINACKPTKAACPFWHQHEELKMHRAKIVEAKLSGDQGGEYRHRNMVMTDILKQLTMTLSKANGDRQQYEDDVNQGYKREIIRMFSLNSCNQKDILILKDASTSFPSTACAVAFYAVTFITIYLHGLASIHKAKFMLIPVINFVLFLMALVLVPMGRIAHRMNWVDDAIYGSIIGIFISVYFGVCILRRFKFKEHISNRKILKAVT